MTGDIKKRSRSALVFQHHLKCCTEDKTYKSCLENQKRQHVKYAFQEFQCRIMSVVYANTIEQTIRGTLYYFDLNYYTTTQYK